MKDSKGHGSNPRAGADAAMAARAKFTASHQSATDKLVRNMKAFVKDNSGAGADDNGMLGVTAFPDVYEAFHKGIQEYVHKYGDAIHHIVSQGKHFFG